MKSFKEYLNECDSEMKSLNETHDLLIEKLITFGGKAYPKFGNVVIMAGGAGCHSKGTKIMMHDMTNKNVEDIVVGDLLMGPDGNFRKVIDLHRGRETMIKVHFNKRDKPEIFNRSHIHSFVASYDKNGLVGGKIYNMTYDEYMMLTPTKRKVLKLRFVGVIDGEIAELPLDPYVLGYWLGDGTVKTPTILVENKYKENLKSELRKRISDDFQINEIKSHHKNCQVLSIVNANNTKDNPIRTYLRSISEDSVKRIPEEYFKSSMRQRFDLLSGLLDSDGYNGSNSFSITTKFNNLKDDIIRLAVSLGLRTNYKIKRVKWNDEYREYWDISISGKNLKHLNLILDHKKYYGNPNKNNLRVSPKFQIMPEDDFYGFEVDGDKLYVMGNGLITHNSGKGFIKDKLVGIEGFTFDVDALKTLAAKTPAIEKRIKEQLGVSLKDIASDLKNPENVSQLHGIIGDFLNLDDNKLRTLYRSILTAHSERKPNIIFDVTLKDLRKLENLSRQVKAIGYDSKNIHIVWVVNDIEVAKEQNAKRSRTVPTQILVNTHRGAANTMGDIINMGNDLKRYMDGDIVFAFNKIKVDSNLEFSKNGGSYIKDANYFYVKRKGKSPLSVKQLSTVLRNKISDYVPKDVQWIGENKSSCQLIGRKQIREFERIVDQLFDKFGIDFNFTKHFGERMSDERNTPCISMKELAEFIKKVYRRQGKSLKGVSGTEAVLNDIQSDLNIPVAVTYDKENDEFDVVMKTIMRKKNFKTSNKKIKY